MGLECLGYNPSSFLNNKVGTIVQMLVDLGNEISKEISEMLRISHFNDI